MPTDTARASTPTDPSPAGVVAARLGPPPGARARRRGPFRAAAGDVSEAEVRFAVRLTPRAVVDRVDGVLDGVLKARVTAPAVSGAANHAIVRLLAAELDVPRTSVRIVAGATAREKLIVVDGVEAPAIVARWPGLRV
jgi:uncharacterized protein